MSGNTSNIRANAALVSEYLREHGWTQRTMFSEDGRVCLMGAICYSEAKNSIELIGQLQNILRNRRDPFSYSLSTWNDKPGRTVEDVYELLDSVGR